ncbi:preprotein translocase subunit YajC [Agreia sp. VKM Ac-1783]|uniref:preprotein translocase subunit YajC n=1 Tax=Agreia sp. VKM Ac-1783 TaxID=1938889 RepID=UPI000A2AEE75|nr:preprotein translocase subunit YajC [Agreia sp. VKM Ac-1783]SMQ67814.1 protein translocase subunit yajC [Agreia sp. VKM Ac-1783]
MALDPLTIGMLAVLAILVFFMFRNSRKRQREAAELQQKVQVGADVMTNFGVFGTILDIDEDDNKVLLETSPGTVLTVHRQVVTRVIDDHDNDTTDDTDTDAATTEPAFGKRVEETVETTPDSKPTSSGSTTSKTDKVDE